MSHARDVLSVYRQWIETIPADVGSAVAFIQYPALAPVPEPVRGVPVIALRLCHPGPSDAAERLLAPVRAISGLMLDTIRSMPYSGIGSVSMDSPLHLPRIGYSESVSAMPESLIWELPEVLTPGAPFLAMELRYVGNGAARPAPGYEGLGYWNSRFLFFGMSVTADAATETAAADMAVRLDAVLSPCRSGTNALTFILAQHTPSRDGDAARVERTYAPAHYRRLAALKARYDPENRLGRDRNIPPRIGPLA